MSARRDQHEVDAYVRATGREPREVPPEHPDRWQWEYRGTKAEREELERMLGLATDEGPVLIAGQEEMF